jgi:cytochrome c oxidase subunit 2
MKAWTQRHPLVATALASALLFVLVAAALTLTTPAPQERVITMTAKRFAYDPSILEVNRGDRVTVLLRSTDVHHGFYLDGYEQEMTARPGQDGTVSFVANRTGRFVFRCSMTCGPFHPYMVGYLRVKPDLRLLGSLWVFGSLLALALVSLRTQTPAPAPGNGQPARKEETP